MRERPRSLLIALLSLALAAAVPACTVAKEPLRAGWLSSGVYAYPPAAKCAAQPSGVPYGELSRWTPPSVSGSFEVSLPWLGPTPVTGRLHAAGEITPRTRISHVAPTPMAVVDERAAGAQVPGFVAGIDLRRYGRIAFVADTSGWMCEYARCNGNETSSLPAPLLQTMGDQIDAAVAGLRPDQRFVVYAGSAWRELRPVVRSARRARRTRPRRSGGAGKLPLRRARDRRRRSEEDV